MALTQWQHHQLEGKEPSGIHTGAAGEDISKRGQGAKFEMHGTAPCLKPLLQEQRASFILLLSLYPKTAYSLSISFFLHPNLVTSQYAYWEKKRTENTDSFFFFFCRGLPFPFWKGRNHEKENQSQYRHFLHDPLYQAFPDLLLQGLQRPRSLILKSLLTTSNINLWRYPTFRDKIET